ncbi:MAG: YjfB family protein [Desulfitobacteriaceae bacterium]
MDIAALSIALNQGKVQQQGGISVMKMAMGVAAEQGNT